jgi:hypothetical protein
MSETASPQSNTGRSRQSSHLIGRAGDGKVQCVCFHDDDVHGLRFAAHHSRRWWKVIAAQSLATELDSEFGRIGARAKMQFPIHPHMLRHGCGYALANAGHDTRALQAWLGHKNIQHTVRYTELARSENRALLIASIARGRRWLNELIADPTANTESIATRECCSVRKVNMTISLAFLAPDLVKAAIEGRLPHGMGVVRLADLPAEWSRQHQMLGLSTQ